MTKFVSKFMSDESGATAIEYGLIAALIAVVIISAVTALGRHRRRLSADDSPETGEGPERKRSGPFALPDVPDAGRRRAPNMKTF